MASLIRKIRGLSPFQQAIIALCLILPAPLVGVSSSFYMPSITAFGSGEILIGKVIWALAKVWLILLPVVWLLCVDKGKLSWSPTSTKGIIAGLLWSIPFAAIIFLTYFLASDSLMSQADAKAIIDEMGISSPAKFLIFASAMSLGNSLMEEYVWRWFVFSKFKVLLGVWPAIILSAFFFTVHHVVIVWNLGDLWLVFLSSIGLFLGGVIWGWLYNRYNSIWPGWICHVVADTVIMWITWKIITGT
jgi:membrane protease YdiL (CAAX protease family)